MTLRIVAIWLLLASLCHAAWTERYVTSAGAGTHAGTSEANAFSLAEAITDSVTAGDGTRYNVQSDAAYANTTTDRDFANAGATAGMLWWRGYNTAIGDLDSVAATTDYPDITFTTGRFIVSGTFQRFSNLKISGAQVTASSGQAQVTASDLWFHKVAVEDTAASANGHAWRITGSRVRLSGCWGKATGSANVFLIPSGGTSLLVGCHAEGGANGFSLSAASNRLLYCVSDSAGANGILLSATDQTVANCSIYNAGVDGIEIDSTSEGSTISNTIIDLWNQYAINSSAGVTSNAILINNAYRDNDGDTVLNQIHESENLGSVTETSAPFTNAGSDDFSLVSGALSKGTGFPGAFTNESFTGYPDRGAVQRQEPSGNTIDPFTSTIPGL